MVTAMQSGACARLRCEAPAPGAQAGLVRAARLCAWRVAAARARLSVLSCQPCVWARACRATVQHCAVELQELGVRHWLCTRAWLHLQVPRRVLPLCMRVTEEGHRVSPPSLLRRQVPLLVGISSCGCIQSHVNLEAACPCASPGVSVTQCVLALPGTTVVSPDLISCGQDMLQKGDGAHTAQVHHSSADEHTRPGTPPGRMLSIPDPHGLHASNAALNF